MSSRDHHFTDEELMQAVDDELSTRRVTRLLAHVSMCADCRARMEKIRAAVDNFGQAYRTELDASLPQEELARHHLEARISQAIHDQETRPTSGRQWSATRVWSIAALLLVCAVTATEVRNFESHRNFVESTEPFRNPALPNRNLTPGSYHTVRLADICSAKQYEQSQVTSEDLKRKVLREYGMTDRAASDHEIDYLVIPELGGTDDVRNLWPEPYDTTEWNAHVKDELEEYLHQLVCEQKLDIAVAQHDIATDWISAYKKYFRTDRPLRSDS